MYDFKTLSSFDFEELVRDLLQAEWKVHLESFKSGRDKGIDLRHIERDKKTIIQCKHYAGSAFSNLLSKLKNEEYDKIGRLEAKRYVLVTSLPLGLGDKSKIEAVLKPYIKAPSDILGREELNNLLGRHPSIEKKHFKLWLSSTAILERVVHNATLVQTDFQVEKILRKLKLYVENASFNGALKILQDHSFLVISGLPGVGKTTLAEMLIYWCLSNEYEPIQIRHDPQEAFELYNPTKKQVFYYDDFLGQTFLNDHLRKNEDAALSDLIEMIKASKNAKLILTTREYILQQALGVYEKMSHSDILSAKYILNIGLYTTPIKAKILYNHLYFSDISREKIKVIAAGGRYRKIIGHSNYNPRVVEWMTKQSQVGLVSDSEYYQFFIENLNNPTKLWQFAYKNISPAGQHLLLTLLSLGGKVKIEILQKAFEKFHAEESARRSIGTTYFDFREALEELDGTFTVGEKSSVAFVNPSVKDFLEGLCAQEPSIGARLLETSTFFEQVFHIASFYRDSDQSASLPESMQPSLVAALNATLLGPYFVEVEGANGTRSRHALDMSLENRFATLIDLADSLDLAILIGLISALIEKFENSDFWENGNPSAWLDCIAVVMSSAIPINDREAIAKRIKTKALPAIDSNSGLDTFHSFAKLLSTGYPFSEDEILNIKGEFAEYSDSSCIDDCEYSGASTEMERFKDDYEFVAGVFDFSRSVDFIDEMSGKIDAAREEEEQHESWDDDRWESSESNSDNDTGVAAMFDNLISGD